MGRSVYSLSFRRGLRVGPEPRRSSTGPCVDLKYQRTTCITVSCRCSLFRWDTDTTWFVFVLVLEQALLVCRRKRSVRLSDECRCRTEVTREEKRKGRRRHHLTVSGLPKFVLYRRESGPQIFRLHFPIHPGTRETSEGPLRKGRRRSKTTEVRKEPTC